MKNREKILLFDLPAAVADALNEGLSAFYDLHTNILATPFDAIISSADNRHAMPPHTTSGIPILILEQKTKKRLSAVRLLLAQMLAEPVLYIEDIHVGDYTFRAQEKCLTSPLGEEITLTDRETEVIAYLARHSTEIISKADLLKNVWRYQEGVDTHTLETHIYRLRQKADGIILTVEDGYRLALPS